MPRYETIAVVDLGSPLAEPCVQALSALGFDARRVSDLGQVVALGSDLGLILLLDCARAAWIFEQIGAHPTLADLPLLGLASERALSFSAEDWLAWPVDPVMTPLVLQRWLAEGRARRETVMSSELLERISDMGMLLDDRSQLERGLETFIQEVAEIFGSSAAAVLVLGKNDREAYVLASTELTDGIPVPLDEATAVALKSRIGERRPVTVDEASGDAMLAFALDQKAGGPLERTVTLPMVIGGQLAGGLLVALGPAPPFPPAQLDHAGALLARLAAGALHGSHVLKRIRDQTKRISLDSVTSELHSRSLQRYREFFESSPDGIIVVDSDASVLHINRAGAIMTGYAAEYLVGRKLTEIVPEHQWDGLQEIVSSAVQGMLLNNFDLQLQTTSDDVITVAVSTSSLKLDKLATVLTFRDVTEARDLETELTQTKEFLERLIASAVDAIVAADAQDGLIILFNRGAENLFRRRAEETVGKIRMSELFPEEEHEDLLRQLHSPHFGGVGRLEQTHKHARDSGGQHVPVSLTASIIEEDEQEVALVAVLTDLREQIQIQERLAMTQERLEVTEKQALIAELAGTTAHELNQPLTSVLGYSELLMKKMGKDGPYSSAVAVIMQEAERMAEIVRKIGKITKYETKSYVGSTQILDLDRAAEE